MKNGLLQFIKKINLAVTLAKNDSLGVLDGLQSFNGICGLVRFFCRSRFPGAENSIRSYLKFSQDTALLAVYDEVSARSDIVKEDFCPIGFEEKTILNDDLFSVVAVDEEAAEFYTDLAAEIVQTDYPALKEELNAFRRRMEKLSDMRLYAAEMEDFNEILAKIESAFQLNVDWNQTGKGGLSVDVRESLILGQQLSPEAQENLLQTVALLFFEHSVFVSSFRAVYTNHASKVNFYGFDRVYPVDADLRAFALRWLDGEAAPSKFLEFKLARLFKLLEFYCPEYDVPVYFNKFAADYPKEAKAAAEEAEAQKKTLKLFSEQHFGLASLPDSSAESSADSFKKHLLMPDFKKETRLIKSPVMYYVPLLFLIYVLLKLFS